jgi:hypothetical protein
LHVSSCYGALATALLLLEYKVVIGAHCSTGVTAITEALETCFDKVDQLKLPYAQRFRITRVSPQSASSTGVDEEDQCVVGTLFQLAQLPDMKADVFIIEEADRANDPDVMVVLTKQTGIRLLVLSGHVSRDAPFSHSDYAKSNPYGELLATSLMARLQRGYQGITRHTLTRE